MEAAAGLVDGPAFLLFRAYLEPATKANSINSLSKLFHSSTSTDLMNLTMEFNAASSSLAEA